MIQSLEYITLFVNDLERSLRFYEEGLGLQVIHRSQHFVLLSAGNVRLDLHEGQPSKGRKSVNLHFRVANVDEAFMKLGDRGLAFSEPPRDQPWGLRSAVLVDPDGFVVEVVTDLGANQSLNRSCEVLNLSLARRDKTPTDSRPRKCIQ